VGAVHVSHASAYHARHHLRYELQHHRLFSDHVPNASLHQRRADAPEPKWAISNRRFGADLSQRQFLVFLLGGRGVHTNHAESDDSSAFPKSCADAEPDPSSDSCTDASCNGGDASAVSRADSSAVPASDSESDARSFAGADSSASDAGAVAVAARRDTAADSTADSEASNSGADADANTCADTDTHTAAMHDVQRHVLGMCGEQLPFLWNDLSRSWLFLHGDAQYCGVRHVSG
jgi:hypothetical protein